MRLPGPLLLSGPAWHNPLMKGPYTRRAPTEAEREQELLAVYDAIEARLKAIGPLRWESITVTRVAGDRYEVRVTV